MQILPRHTRTPTWRDHIRPPPRPLPAPGPAPLPWENPQPPLLYLSSPVACYAQTQRYHAALSALHRSFPDCAVLPARGLYPDYATFRRVWPEVLSCLAGLVVLADTDGTVGRGVWQEYWATRSRGLPCYGLRTTPAGASSLWRDPRLYRLGDGDYRRFAALVGGR